MSAPEYAEKPHTVLEIDTEGLVTKYLDKIELSHMNTGATRPIPHPRGLATFRKMEYYPYIERQRLNDYSAVAELTVMHGVPDIRAYVHKAEHAVVDRVKKYSVVEPLFSAKPS